MTAAFVAAVFALAWASWLVASHLVAAGDTSFATRTLLFLPGTFAPAIVALVLTAARDGAGGVRALLRGLARWDVRPRYYVFALFFMAAVKLAAAALHRGAVGEWPPFGATPALLLFGAVIVSTPFQIGEELGWRGYALPRLAAGMGMRAASVALGAVWALWHLPLFYLHGADMVGHPFPVFLVSVTVLSVALAWLYDRTGGSVLLVMLMHASVNNTTGIVPSGIVATGEPMALHASTMAWLTAGVLVAVAAALLLAASWGDRDGAGR